MGPLAGMSTTSLPNLRTRSTFFVHLLSDAQDQRRAYRRSIWCEMPHNRCLYYGRETCAFTCWADAGLANAAARFLNAAAPSILTGFSLFSGSPAGAVMSTDTGSASQNSPTYGICATTISRDVSNWPG